MCTLHARLFLIYFALKPLNFLIFKSRSVRCINGLLNLKLELCQCIVSQLFLLLQNGYFAGLHPTYAIVTTSDPSAHS